MKKRLFGLIACLMLVFSLAVSVSAATVALNKKTATIKVKGTVTLKLKNASGTVTWKSSNTKVATVSKGKVTGKKAGKATITATYKKKTYKCKVTVKAASASKYTAAQIRSYAKQYKGKNINLLINKVGKQTKKIKGASCNGGGYEYEYQWIVGKSKVRVQTTYKKGANIITDVG